MTQYKVTLWIFGRPYEHYIDAESQEEAMEIAENKPLLEVLNCIIAKDVADSIKVYEVDGTGIKRPTK